MRRRQPAALGTLHRFRFTPFRTGLIVGLFVALAAPWTIGALLKAMSPGLGPPPFNVQVRSSGADVSRHGGVKVAVEDARGKVVQSCNQVCDDFELDANGGDNSYRVRVLNAAGECVACDEGRYVSGGYGSPIDRWTVSGRDALTVKVSTLRRNAAGEFVAAPMKAAPTEATTGRPGAAAAP